MLCYFVTFVLVASAATSTVSFARMHPARMEHSESLHAGIARDTDIQKRAISTYSGPFSGDGTFYGNDGSGGTCLLPARSDTMFAAFPGSAWNNAAMCGSCVKVTGPRGSVNVQITNKCPECVAGSLDLSTNAFTKIADQSAGRVSITWSFVDCKSVGLETQLVSFVWKTGSSQYWAAIQARHTNIGIRSLAVLQNGAYIDLQRQDYNYFLAASGLGPGPFTIKLTLQDDTSTTYSNVKLNSIIGDA